MIRDERQNGLNEGVVEARAGQLPHVAQVLPSYFPGGLSHSFLESDRARGCSEKTPPTSMLLQ